MQSKDKSSAIARELKDLATSNSYFKSFKQPPSYKRGIFADLNSFDFKRDKTIIGEDLENRIFELIQNSNEILYGQIKEICSNELFLQNLRIKRKTAIAVSRPISEDVTSIARLYNINESVQKNIIDLELNYLKKLSDLSGDVLKYTDINKRIGKLEKLQTSHKRKAPEEIEDIPPKKSQHADVNIPAFEFLPVNTKSLSKLECGIIIEKISLLLKGLRSDINIKEKFFIQYNITNALKDGTKLRINKEEMEYSDVQMKILTNLFEKFNIEHLFVISEQLKLLDVGDDLSLISPLCQRLQVILDNELSYQNLIDKDFSLPLPDVSQIFPSDNNNQTEDNQARTYSKFTF